MISSSGPAARTSARLPFDPCFPAHLKHLLRELLDAVQLGAPESFSRSMRECRDFLMRYWAGAAVGALERIGGATMPVPDRPSWPQTLQLLRHAVMAWEAHTQSSFRTLLRLGFFEAGEPPRPRLQCRWLGIAGDTLDDLPAAGDVELWCGEGQLPGAMSRYLELLSDWLRASRPLFLKLIRRYSLAPNGQISVVLEDGRGKQLPMRPALPWTGYAPFWGLTEIEAAEKAAALTDVPAAVPSRSDLPAVPAPDLVAEPGAEAAEESLELADPVASPSGEAAGPAVSEAAAPASQPDHTLQAEDTGTAAPELLAVHQPPEEPATPTLEPGLSPEEPAIQESGLAVEDPAPLVSAPDLSVEVAPPPAYVVESPAVDDTGVPEPSAETDSEPVEHLAVAEASSELAQAGPAELSADWGEPDQVSGMLSESAPPEDEPPAPAGEPESARAETDAPASLQAELLAAPQAPDELQPSAASSEPAPEPDFAPLPEIQTPDAEAMEPAAEPLPQTPSSAVDWAPPGVSSEREADPEGPATLPPPSDEPAHIEPFHAAEAAAVDSDEPVEHALLSPPEDLDSLAEPAEAWHPEPSGTLGLEQGASLLLSASDDFVAQEEHALSTSDNPPDLEVELQPGFEADLDSDVVEEPSRREATLALQLQPETEALATEGDIEQPSASSRFSEPALGDEPDHDPWLPLTDSGEDELVATPDAVHPSPLHAEPSVGPVALELPLSGDTEEAAWTPELARELPFLNPAPDLPEFLPPDSWSVLPEVEDEAAWTPEEAAFVPPDSWDSDELDSLLGLGASAVAPPASPRWRPRALELPAALPSALRSRLEASRATLMTLSASPAVPADDTSGLHEQRVAQAMLETLAPLLDLTARVACAGLAEVGPLPEPLKAVLAQPMTPVGATKLLHFAWTALQPHPRQPAAALLRALFFELNATEVPRLHARWLGLPDAPAIGLQHVTTWVRLAQGQLRLSEAEWTAQWRELSDVVQLWLVAGAPLWAACDATLTLRPDGLWSGGVSLGGTAVSLESDVSVEEPLELLLSRWRQSCAAARPPFFLLDETTEFVETAAPGSGMVVQGPVGLGKSFLLRDLVARQPQLGETRCGWIPFKSRDSFAPEELNAQLCSLEEKGFPWHALGATALADLHRHSPPELLFTHYFAALRERNAVRGDGSVRITLLEDGSDRPEELLWCHVPLPDPFVWVATTDAPLPPAWNVPCPPARLPVSPDEPQAQSLAQTLLGGLHLTPAVVSELVERSDFDLLALTLWAGLLSSGQVAQPGELPAAVSTPDFVLRRALADRNARLALLMLGAGPEGLPLPELIEGPWSSSLRSLLQHYSYLLVEKPGERVALRHERLCFRLRELAGAEVSDALSQFTSYLLVKLNTNGRLDVELGELFGWIVQAGAAESAWTALTSSALRGWREDALKQLEDTGQAHRKVQLLGKWLQMLELALHYARSAAPLQLHAPLEEQLWSLSSRALTLRSLGRLHEALSDIEQAIAGFRPLTEERPELLNGLAAACNRRAEILRELGRPAQAMADADEAIRSYALIAPGDPVRWEPLWALALHHRSELEQELGRLEDAEADLRKALNLYAPHRDSMRSRLQLELVSAYLSRAALAARREDGLLARDDCGRALELLAKVKEDWTELRVLEARAQTRLAEAHLLLEEESRALEASDRATALWRGLIDEGRLDLRPLYAAELCRRGRLLFKLGQLDLAFEAAQPGTEMLLQLTEAEGRHDLNTSLGQALLLRGRIWQRRGRVESARRDLSLAYHYLLGQSQFWDSERNHPAINVLVEVVVLLSGLNLQMGQRPQAVEQLQSALAWVARGVEGSEQENRALLESLLGRAVESSAEALAAHGRALELYNHLVDEQGQYQLLPRLAEAHLGRARTYRLRGEDELALADAEQAVDLLTFLSEKGGDPMVLRLLPPARFEAAEILGSLGQTEVALVHLRGGLDDLELLQSDFDGAEFLLQRASALSLHAGMVDAQAGVRLLGEALHTLAEARSAGAETSFFEGDVRRRRAELLLSLNQTADAMADLLAGTGESVAGLDNVLELLRNLLAEARTHVERGQLQSAVSAYDHVIQMAELCARQGQGEETREFLVRALHERAMASWDSEKPDWALADLAQAIATWSVGKGTRPEAMEPDARLLLTALLETRARLHARLAESGTPSVMLANDVARALVVLGDLSPELRASLLWMRIELDPLEAGAWSDMEELAGCLPPGHTDRARLDGQRALWLERWGWPERAAVLWADNLLSLRRSHGVATGRERDTLAGQFQALSLQRMASHPEGPEALLWVQWLNEALLQHPELAHRLDMGALHSWFRQASPEQQELFARGWLSTLASHTEVPDSLYELIPAALGSLSLEHFDAETWANLIDILDRRADDPNLARLTWEGKTLGALLTLDREAVSRIPELEMALAECLRHWAELPPGRLALAGVSVDQISSWLEG